MVQGESISREGTSRCCALCGAGQENEEDIVCYEQEHTYPVRGTRLIKNRAEALYNIYGVATDFLAIQKRSRISNADTDTIKAGGILHIIGHSKYDFFIRLAAAEKEMDRMLRSGGYSCVILSGGGLEKTAAHIKASCSLRVFLDIHGAAEDALELALQGGWMKRLYFTAFYRVGERYLARYAQDTDGFFVVTSALRKYVEKKYRTKKGAVFYEVPCAASGMAFPEKEYECYRRAYRKKYGIDGDTVVFVYSGGTSPWQCIDETIELYKKIAEGMDQKSALLVFSYNADQIRAKIADVPSISVDSYESSELRKVLCAGDYAFLLRRDCVTNNVAFPNKYLEYIQARMKIIGTPYIYEVASQIRKYGTGFLYDFRKRGSGHRVCFK